jgi:hypothetical protein
MRRWIIILCSAGVGAAGCAGDDAGVGNDELAGSASGAANEGAADPEGGAGGTNVAAGSGGASAGHGGAISASGVEGGSIQTGGSTNAGGTSGTGGGGGGATGAAGSSASAGAGGSDGAVAGTVWYDGESGGLPFSAGASSLSAASSASETSNDPHGGKNCLSVSLNAATAWGHLGWTPSLDHKEYDLTAHAKLEFWIRGTSAATAVQLEMHGPGGGCPWVNVKDYLSGGVTTAWQKVSIPLSAFKMDQKRIQVVDFWLTAGTGSFFIDDGRWN